MRRMLLLLSLCGFVAATGPATAAEGRVIKVLPHLLDLKGRHTLTPSLYDRDAYQARLRQNPDQRSGIRFDVHWKASGPAFSPLKLRVELRGAVKGEPPTVATLEATVPSTSWFGRWISLPLTGEEYKKFGDLTAWRVTLWEEDTLLSEQKSFLW